MIYVIERFQLTPEAANESGQVMQQLDDLVGPGAHGHAGWAGHAIFLQKVDDPSEVLMLYPWKSRELHAELFEGEEPILAEFYKKFCSGPRRLEVYRPLEVEVEHDKAAASKQPEEASQE
jgi:heme-degrading monooxygenase HmoA